MPEGPSHRGGQERRIDQVEHPAEARHPIAGVFATEVALEERLDEVAERADISRDTLRRLEHGDPGVSLGTVLGVARALGALDRVVDALDPYQTDLGRARAASALPKRVRH